MLDLRGAGDGRIYPFATLQPARQAISYFAGNASRTNYWFSVLYWEARTTILLELNAMNSLKLCCCHNSCCNYNNKWICSFVQTEIIYCIMGVCESFYNSTQCDLILSGHTQNHCKGGCTGKSTMLCWFVARVEKICRVIRRHTASPAASEIELMYCTSSDFRSSENIHGFHQI